MKQEVIKEIEIHLAEYTALREEIVQYNQRIDRTVGVYLSALFGLSGYLLRPESEFDLQRYIESINASQTETGLILVLGILNGLLFLRLQSFFLAVLAMSQYTATVIRPRCVALLGKASLLEWDGTEVVRAKRYWLPSRSVSQFGFGAVAIIVSIFSGLVGLPMALKSTAIGVLLAVLMFVLGYSLYTTLRIIQASSHFHEAAASLTRAWANGIAQAVKSQDERVQDETTNGETSMSSNDEPGKEESSLDLPGA